MSTPENIVVSLDWAKKLKEAEWPQGESVFWWWEDLLKGQPTALVDSLPKSLPRKTLSAQACNGNNDGNDPMIDELHEPARTGKDYEDDCPAFDWKHRYTAAPTAEEILRRLPGNLMMAGEGYDAYLQFLKLGDYKWILTYMGKTEPKGQPMKKEDSLANAAAAMYVYLADNKLLPTP